MPKLCDSTSIGTDFKEVGRVLFLFLVPIPEPSALDTRKCPVRGGLKSSVVSENKVISANYPKVFFKNACEKFCKTHR